MIYQVCANKKKNNLKDIFIISYLVYSGILSPTIGIASVPDM